MVRIGDEAVLALDEGLKEVVDEAGGLGVDSVDIGDDGSSWGHVYLWRHELVDLWKDAKEPQLW